MTIYKEKIYAPGFNTGYTCENCGCRKTHAVLRKTENNLEVIITCSKCGASSGSDIGMLIGFTNKPLVVGVGGGAQ